MWEIISSLVDSETVSNVIYFPMSSFIVIKLNSKSGISPEEFIKKVKASKFLLGHVDFIPMFKYRAPDEYDEFVMLIINDGESLYEE